MHIKSIIRTLYCLLRNTLFFVCSRKQVIGKNNVILRAKFSCLYRCQFDIEGNDNVIEIAEHVRLNNVLFYIHGNNCHVKIGRWVRISEGGEFWLEDNGTWVNIGDGTGIERTHFAATEDGCGIEIGKNCMFSNDIDIRTGDSHSIVNLKGERINQPSSVYIGNHVWIGAHVSILKGVHISPNCIVGMRSVITAHPPPYSQGAIIAGTPARIIKENVSWLPERI